MNDELDTLTDNDTDLEQRRVDSSADQHGEIIDLEHSDGIAVGMEHVVIGDPVFPCASRITGSIPVNLP